MLKQFTLAAIFAALFLARSTLAQSTAFTYQGEVRSNGTPANGPHDLRFRLFDAASGGTPIGSQICVDDVPVAGGRFTTTIDFGSAFATTSARFLEIEVRRDTGLNCSSASGFVVLTPRQPISPTPLATHARSAFTLDAPNGSRPAAALVSNTGNVGINTPAPLSRLHVTSGALADGIRLTGIAGNDPSISLWEGSIARGTLGLALATGNYSVDALSGDVVLRAEPGRKLLFQSGLSTSALAITSSNNIGIGTPTPNAKLDVRGNIRLGTSGQYFAPAGEENLRIIRGSVFHTGTVTAGSGFTVTPNGDGQYTINFNTPFAARPTVTASLFGNSTELWIEVESISTTSARVVVYIIIASIRNEREHAFEFIAVGPR